MIGEETAESSAQQLDIGTAWQKTLEVALAVFERRDLTALLCADSYETG